MFTTGAVFLPFFSITTFLISVPTGVKMFNWIATMWRGKLRFTTAMLFAVGFLSSFLIGGLDGAFSASTPIDFALQDTYWIVSHLHYVLFGGSAMAIMAATYYWFPKMTGRMLNERIGKIQFAIIFIGTQVTFFPMHLLGLSGMPRRIQDYAPNAGWQDLNVLATIGSYMLGLGILLMFWNFFITLRGPQDAGDDPWDANTLEWATTSPPPSYNFDHLPEVRSERPLFDLKHGGPAHGKGQVPALTAGEGAS
jgi:heme/copper-type cytochrome/quinol oxidase subunit 1